MLSDVATKIAREALKEQSLGQIANTIERDWCKVSVHAQPYLNAMLHLESINDRYGADSGASVVAYFLSNASSYKGEVAKLLKAELNRRVKEFYKK